jgi:glyoxylase-like metal-dependent hydrolase (beta-lactamase superfamily II)
MKKLLLIITVAVLVSEVSWAKSPSLRVRCLDLGKGTANCYVVSSNDKNAYIIDPGGNAEEILKHLENNKLKVLGYLITHGHNDHIRALPDLHKKSPASSGIHSSDIPLYRKGMGTSGPFDLFFEDGKTYGTDDLKFTVIHSPGHSPGGVCFYFEEAGLLFTGDTLFAGGRVGRTDLDGGSNEELTASLKKLSRLPPLTKIFPGHGETTTRDRELSDNF